MKQLPLLLLFFCFLAGSATAQSKTEFGITTEGSWFMPGAYDSYSPPNKNGFSAGIGIYASRIIIGKLSADVGLMYHFKQMKEYYYNPLNTSTEYGGYGGYSPYGYGYGYGYDYGYDYSDEGKINGWKTYPLHQVVVPAHIQYLVYKSIFARGGIEAGWLTNYDTGNDKVEWNWTIGFGSHLKKLKWTLEYVRSFNNVGFANGLWVRSDGFKSATVYRNNMVQLSLSYPLWQKK